MNREIKYLAKRMDRFEMKYRFEGKIYDNTILTF